ncbi:hypothetical protein DNTS_016701 [Danionella cerebrum]|uniref:MD-2-related lipid-recognition domain-containing protein n=1 Tax=Danionella cerebrum TaxID=2873325 RepID=A0A553QEF2_9TELE|nr:hypothetical protein DNTS_016701 [Danionella translucida]
MKSLISALLVLFAGSCYSLQGSRKPFKSTRVFGFSWQNCGSPSDPANLKTLNISPDPIRIPGRLTADASGSTSVELASPLSVSVVLEREVAGLWVKIPCVDELGSCHYPDACELLDRLVPPGQDCPEPLHTYGLPCHCPFKAGDYALPTSEISIPEVELPGWLANGNYRVKGILESAGAELGCVKISFSLHSSST